MVPYYQDGSVTIWHGDCREILPTLEPVDLVLTDPPYGIGEARGKNKSRGCRAVARDYGVSDWDDHPIDPLLLDIAKNKGDWQIVFGGNYYKLPPSPCWLVWDKCKSGDMAECELAWTNLPGAVRRFRWLWDGYWQENMRQKDIRVHPTQKPVALMKWCIGLAPARQTILDPFMGSGTTLRAAKDLGLKAIGIEIEERYCEIAAKRMSQEVLQFAATGD